MKLDPPGLSPRNITLPIYLRLGSLLLSLIMLATETIAEDRAETRPQVVLIHGLGLGRWSMNRVERVLTREGYQVTNLDYDSLHTPLQILTTQWLPHELVRHEIGLGADDPPLFIVTHSMGGIVLRGYLQEIGVPASLSRVVMLAPPNRGSSLVDRIGDWRAFKISTGINGQKLNTRADSFPNRLPSWPQGPALGIIAGNRPINPLLAYWTGGPGDGKVRVEETKLEGMIDHIVVPHSHTWIQYRTPVINQISTFLRDGRFTH